MIIISNKVAALIIAAVIGAITAVLVLVVFKTNTTESTNEPTNAPTNAPIDNSTNTIAPITTNAPYNPPITTSAPYNPPITTSAPITTNAPYNPPITTSAPITTNPPTSNPPNTTNAPTSNPCRTINGNEICEDTPYYLRDLDDFGLSETDSWVGMYPPYVYSNGYMSPNYDFAPIKFVFDNNGDVVIQHANNPQMVLSSSGGVGESYFVFGPLPNIDSDRIYKFSLSSSTGGFKMEAMSNGRKYRVLSRGDETSRRFWATNDTDVIEGAHYSDYTFRNSATY
jgi:hypothetical protein